jgi:fructoselysine and glucoselysine-specific PTS system IIB component
MIKLVRIDYRLLHGQVVLSWINNLNVERIIIIDDFSSSDETQKTTLKLAKPQNTKLNIFSIDQALARKVKISDLTDNTIIIFGDTKTCLTFLKEFKGDISEVNYGGLPKKEGSIEFDKSVYMNDEEIRDSKELKNLGLKLYSQQTPTTKAIKLNDIL